MVPSEDVSFFERYVRSRDLPASFGSTPHPLDDLILEQSLAGIYLMRPDEFLYVNRTSAAMFGYSVEDILRDKSPLDLVAPEDRDRVRRNIRERMEGSASRVHYQFRGMRKDGRFFDVEARGYALEFEGEPAVGGTLLEVTERESTKHDLEESRRRFRQLAENIEATVFLYDLEYEELLFINSHYETMFGLDRTQARENPLSFVDAVHPEDRAWVMERLQRFLEDPESSPTDYEYRIVDDDGEVHWLWTRWVPVEHRDGHVVRVAGYTTDITQRKEAEEYLRTNERRLREMAENIEQGFYLVNENYTEALYVNPVVEELWGVSREALLERPDRWLERIHPEDRDRVEGTLRGSVREGFDESISFEYRVVRENGDVRWLRTVVSPIVRERSEADRIVSVSEDITREKHISQNLEQSLEETQTLLREVHHRVKNNLQVIVSLLGLQKRQFEDGEMKRVLERCQNRIYSMALIHRKIYDADRFTAVDFSEYVPDLLQDLVDAYSLDRRQIALEYDLETFRLDFDRLVPLGMALSEVVTNALEHAFEGRDDGTIEVRSRCRDERLELSVRDDGVGWSPEGPIEEAGSLGLQLLDSLIQNQLRGSVEFEQNDGVTVHFSVPLDPDH